MKYAADSPQTVMSETVTARVPIGLMATLAELPVEALPPGAASIGALILGEPKPLESSGYSVGTREACRSIGAQTPKDGDLYVGFLGFTPGKNAPSTPGGSAEIVDVGLSLAISPNLSSYAYTERQVEQIGCGRVARSGTDPLSWGTTLGAYLLEITATGDKGAWINDWKPVNGDIIATKDLTLSTTDGSSSSSGPVNLVLFHTPK